MDWKYNLLRDELYDYLEMLDKLLVNYKENLKEFKCNEKIGSLTNGDYMEYQLLKNDIINIEIEMENLLDIVTRNEMMKLEMLIENS